MAKNDKVSKKDEGGGVPMSKNQRNKAARARAAARSGKVTHHGGICSSCGQTSTSCTTGSMHDSCIGYAKEFEFKNEALNALGERFAMLADGTPIRRIAVGRWITTEELARRRGTAEVEAIRILKGIVEMTTIYKRGDDGLPIMVETKTSDMIFRTRAFERLDIRNGLGEPVTLIHGRWRTESEVDAHMREMSENDDVTEERGVVNDTVAGANSSGERSDWVSRGAESALAA